MKVVCNGCKINYWDCKYNGYEEDWGNGEEEEEYRYYNCSHPEGNGCCNKENKYNGDEDYCELGEHD